jgi:hypothetical protein
MQTLSEYRVLLGGALTVGVTSVEVKEIVYQAVPYVGILGRLIPARHQRGPAGPGTQNPSGTNGHGVTAGGAEDGVVPGGAKGT